MVSIIKHAALALAIVLAVTTSSTDAVKCTTKDDKAMVTAATSEVQACLLLYPNSKTGTAALCTDSTCVATLKKMAAALSDCIDDEGDNYKEILQDRLATCKTTTPTKTPTTLTPTTTTATPKTTTATSTTPSTLAPTNTTTSTLTPTTTKPATTAATTTTPTPTTAETLEPTSGAIIFTTTAPVAPTTAPTPKPATSAAATVTAVASMSLVVMALMLAN